MLKELEEVSFFRQLWPTFEANSSKPFEKDQIGSSAMAYKRSMNGTFRNTIELLSIIQILCVLNACAVSVVTYRSCRKMPYGHMLPNGLSGH